MIDRPTTDSRFHLLDAIRGFAALAIVFWHWQHFYPADRANFVRAAQPFYEIFYPLYEAGWMAVELFFALSGFIFFWLYHESISGGRMAAGRFAFLRFSRLYPLHFLTLLFMAGGQIYRHSIGLPSFVYDSNGAWYFLANLLFVQAWPVGSEESFNGPTWSVSIEVLLYAFFFGFALLCRKPRVLSFLICVVVGLVVMRFHRTLGRGILEFYMGGARLVCMASFGRSSV